MRIFKALFWLMFAVMMSVAVIFRPDWFTKTGAARLLEIVNVAEPGSK